MTKREILEALKPLEKDAEVLFYVQDYREYEQHNTGKLTYDVSIVVNHPKEGIVCVRA